MDFEDLSGEKAKERIPGDPALIGDGAWIEGLLHHCREKGLLIPDTKSEARMLEAAIRKGFVRGNVLILTAGRVDKRAALYQAVSEGGIVVDCSVPAGNTAAEKKVRDAVFKACIREILAQHQKTMAPEAYAAVYEMTGFELRVLSANVEKLIAYAGKRERITLDDVKAVLFRTKKDPVFELTGAVLERNPDKALFFLDSLLRADFHPMAILSALVNQVRRLMVAKAFMEEQARGMWPEGCDFKTFKARLLPRLKAFEKQMEESLPAWEMPSARNTSRKAGKKRGGTGSSTDLTLTRGSASAYPAFKLLQAAERFQKGEITDALMVLCDTDRRLKTTPHSPRMLLERALVRLCCPPGPGSMPKGKGHEPVGPID